MVRLKAICWELFIVGKAEMYPFPEKIQEDLKASENFITEISKEDLQEPEIDQAAMQEKMITETPLTKGMNEVSHERYQEVIESYGLTEEDVAPLNRYGLSMTLFALGLQEGADDLNILEEYGVDQQLTLLHQKNPQQKNIALETVEFQNEIIEQSYNVPENINKWVETLLTKEESIESASSVGAVQKYIDGEIDEISTNEEQNEIINLSRNKTWSEKLPEYLQQKNQSFIAVVAAHLGNERGLIALLEEQGYEVTPVTFD